MPYFNDVPQGNETISASQPRLLANSAFVQTDLQVDHVFNGNNSPQPEGTHLQAQMKNRADPGALPANINGIYYVSGGKPKFYNGTANTLAFSPGAFPVQSLIVTGVSVVTASFTNTGAAVFPNSAGTIYLWESSANPPDATQVASASYYANASGATIKLMTTGQITFNFSGLNLRSACIGPSFTASLLIIYNLTA